MTGFELQTSGFESNRSTKWATTTAQIFSSQSECLQQAKLDLTQKIMLK